MMKKTNTFHNLIFLISQPRAGSTMLQRILGSHPDIHTTSEPWVMLHPLYSTKKTGIETEYSSDLALNALSDFLSQIENGTAVYREKLRQMYGSLYESLLKPTGKKYYLDKTPRYYFVINKLCEIFPSAKFIILFRNPLAVLTSIIESWTKMDWRKLSEYKYDLLSAPDYLLDGLKRLGANAFRLQYENVLTEPENEIKKVCDFIGIKFDKTIIEYGNSGLPKWQYGDQKTVYEKTKPDDLHSNKWIQSLSNPQAWRTAREYLDYIGEDRINKMGYSFKKLDVVLDKNKPKVDIDKDTVGLSLLLDNTSDLPLERKLLREQIKKTNEQIRLKDEQNKNIILQLQQKEQQIQKKEQVIQSKENQLQQKDKLIESKDAQLQQRDEQLRQKNEQIRQKDQQMENNDQIIQSKENQLQQINQQIQEVRNSYSFRIGKIIILPFSISKNIIYKLKSYSRYKNS